MQKTEKVMNKHSLHGKTNWTKLHAMSMQEVEQNAKNDCYTMDEADWQNAEILHTPKKVYIHAGFDEDVVDWFKSFGRGYQTRMNAVLRSYMQKVA